MEAMSNHYPRWEVTISIAEFRGFMNLYYDMEHNVPIAYMPCSNNKDCQVWCNPCEEFKILALLRFTIQQHEPYGVEIDFK